MNILSSLELNQWVSKKEGWQIVDDTIIKNFKFASFNDAFGFMNKLAIQAEKYDHHPTILNRYNTVKISMNTHDAGNKITDRDIKLAEAIESLL